MVDFVLLDSAPGLGREAVSALDAAEEIFFITTPTIPNLMDVKRCTEVCKGMDSKKMNLVLNMVDNTKYEFPDKEVEKMIKMPILGEIPFDKNVADSVALGEPVLVLRPESPASIRYMQIAASLIGHTFIPKKSKIGSIINKIKGKLSRK